MQSASISQLPIDTRPSPPSRRSQGRASRESHSVERLPRVVRGPSAAAPGQGHAFAAAPAPRRASKTDHPGRGDALLYLSLTLLIGAAWLITQLQLFKASDDASYWIAVTGGVMMLALFTYPLRKYLRFMQGLGKVKWWFWLHLLLGIAGPWLILVHSTFRVGSLNAGVAIYSMGIVVASGVIGRFIHVRVHRGLNGEHMSLIELRERAGLVESNARSRLHFSPAVECRLLAFEQHELHAKPSWLTHLRQVTVLPLQQRVAYLRCVAELHRRLREMAAAQQWNASELQRRERRARRLAAQYLDAVVRVAQYSAYDRVFALWHMAHLPFVYLLVISAVVHVVAVHAY